MSEGRELAWDDEIQKDGEDFDIIPDGSECKFTVKEFKRATSKKGQRMAELGIMIEDNIGRKGFCREYFVLIDTQEWKICKFFKALGFRKHGERIKMDWSKVTGAIGSCVVSVEKYTTDKGETRESNKIKTYHDSLKNKIEAESANDVPTF